MFRRVATKFTMEYRDMIIRTDCLASVVEEVGKVSRRRYWDSSQEGKFN